MGIELYYYSSEDDRHFPWEVTCYVMRRTTEASVVRIPKAKTLTLPHISCPGLADIEPGKVGSFRVNGTRLRESELYPDGEFIREARG